MKRWTISLPNPDGYEIKPWKPGLFEAPTQIVLAVDYDKLHAECVRLRAVLETLLKRHDDRTAWFAENIWDEARDVLYGKEKNL